MSKTKHYNDSGNYAGYSQHNEDTGQTDHYNSDGKKTGTSYKEVRPIVGEGGGDGGLDFVMVVAMVMIVLIFIGFSIIIAPLFVQEIVSGRVPERDLPYWIAILASMIIGGIIGVFLHITTERGFFNTLLKTTGIISLIILLWLVPHTMLTGSLSGYIGKLLIIAGVFGFSGSLYFSIFAGLLKGFSNMLNLNRDKTNEDIGRPYYDE